MSDRSNQEDEVTALSSIYEERVFTAAEDGKGGQFVVNVTVPENFHVHLDGPTSISVALKTGAKPIQKDDASLLHVQFLPPIMLHFQYPDNYPSCRAPDFTLSCKWLSPRQLTKLCSRLDELWDESHGEVILFEWIQFLQDEAFTFLDLEDPLQLDYSYIRTFSRSASCNSEKAEANHVSGNCHASGGQDRREMAQGAERCSREASDTVDKRAIQDVASLTNLIQSLVHHDCEERQRAFDLGFYHCQICFEEKMGSECLPFPHCDHVYCKVCITEYFSVQITDGNVKALTCPEQKCESQASQTQVRSLVSEEMFARYDRLLLQLSLDGMEDVTNCPRIDCQSPVLKEEDSTMAVCPSCHLAFCTLCNMAYHGVSPCRIKKDDILKLKHEYDNGDDETREMLERKYGRKKLKKLFEDVRSEIWIHKNSKNCPNCGSSIQKMDGCNKMTCTKCNSYFCWLCMKKLSKTNPYLHFQELNSPCQNLLFQGIENPGGRDDDDEENEVLGDNWLNVDENLDQLLFYL